MKQEFSDKLLPSKTSKVTILIADDHPLLRQSLRNVLEKESDFEVLGEAIDGEEAVKLAAELHPDVVIMDIGMPKMDGLEATRRIKSSNSNIAILVLTIHTDDNHILAILQAGASGYLTKSVFGKEVVQSVRGIATGEMILSPQVGQRLLKFASRFPTKAVTLTEGEKLSAREVEVLKLAARGMNNKAISTELGLSIRTIKGSLANTFSKLHAASRTEAIAAALRIGVISLDDIR